jgi:hypothetical protein
MRNYSNTTRGLRWSMRARGSPVAKEDRIYKNGNRYMIIGMRRAVIHKKQRMMPAARFFYKPRKGDFVFVRGQIRENYLWLFEKQIKGFCGRRGQVCAVKEGELKSCPKRYKKCQKNMR